MNVHPLIIHFPIALWFVYCGILLVQFFWWRDNEQLNTIKYFCLIIGTIWGFFALQSGEVAADIYGKSPLVHTHEEWADATFKLFVVMSLITIFTLQSWTKIYTWDTTIRKHLTTLLHHKMIALVWIAWIVSLTIVGALGGAITRGTHTGDPLSDLVVELLVR